MTEEEIFTELQKKVHTIYPEASFSFTREMLISSLGTKKQQLVLWKRIEIDFHVSIPHYEQETIETIDDLVDCIHYHRHELIDVDYDGNPIPFSWKKSISPLQRWILKISARLGFLIFFVGVHITIWASFYDQLHIFDVHVPPSMGGYISSFGLFVAIQMFWGIDAGFTFLHKGWLVKHIQHRTLFWLLIFTGFIIDGIGLSGLLSLYGYDLLILDTLGY